MSDWCKRSIMNEKKPRSAQHDVLVCHNIGGICNQSNFKDLSVIDIRNRNAHS
ncbi:unnamed protein product [Sphenostylis stenocarpa]|uniref:Uncharacterized protein n=1 Tax=Sphenostylis stenocarpa TaxID=92480 RepID=A0AA86SCJ1_9FABA|nr:unnamed protein product [Sphenostylis stenocarpa]